jgi:hypothetical protein
MKVHFKHANKYKWKQSSSSDQRLQENKFDTCFKRKWHYTIPIQ